MNNHCDENEIALMSNRETCRFGNLCIDRVVKFTLFITEPYSKRFDSRVVWPRSLYNSLLRHEHKRTKMCMRSRLHGVLVREISLQMIIIVKNPYESYIFNIIYLINMI